MVETLLAVAVGAILTGTTGWLADRRRSKQHDRQQWHQQRLAVYTTAWTRLSHVALATQGLLTKYGKPRLLPSPWTPIRVVQQAGPIKTAIEQAIEALTVIRFIGSKEVVDAADRCTNVIVQLGDAIGAGTATPDRVEALVKEMNNQRHHFVDVARTELDVDPRPFGRRRSKQLGTSAERIAMLDPPAASGPAPETGNPMSVRSPQNRRRRRSPEPESPALVTHSGSE